VITILDGSTFCISDERGDLVSGPCGLFASDVRRLSRFVLTINGERPLLLSSGKVEYFSAAFFLRNPLADLPQDSLSIARTRFVVDSLQERIVIRNEATESLRFTVGIEFGADFADIFAVKARDFTLGHPENAPPLPPLAAESWNGGSSVVLGDDGDRTELAFSQQARHAGGRSEWDVELAPRERWDLVVDVVLGKRADAAQAQFGRELQRVHDSLAAWRLRVPQLRSSSDTISSTFGQSVADLASLRMRAAGHLGTLPAAGMPWFMTVFGRDTVITCLQTLLFGPELARTALRVLAELQARTDDAERDAEPGKIVHEVRHGKAAAHWFDRYYGSVDATPLFLILISEVWRWTDDIVFASELEEPARAALGWIDDSADRDGDGFVEFERRTARGLAVQTWKDSADSQRFRNAEIAEAPIAACEVQGYVYDAKLRIAELARDVWRDRALADRLEREAVELKARFNEAFWVEERGTYALALDREKRQVDSLTSNVGHLLWSGIVPDERVDAVVDALFARALWSGWGVRTMSADDAGFNPLSYHNGTVWPHDNSLIAWGLARHGRWDECHRIARRLFEAASHFGWQLPEVFAGLPRSETPFPIAYPTATRPQAWAAGAPVLLLQLLLGLRPNRHALRLETAAPELPAWVGSLHLTGIRAFDRAWDVHVEKGNVRVEEASVRVEEA
jgi:glycogen debranching enzyme